jgi:hypothetical protein
MLLLLLLSVLGKAHVLGRRGLQRWVEEVRAYIRSTGSLTRTDCEAAHVGMVFVIPFGRYL